jgi:uroporphyrinogen decarboxylase
LHWQSIESSEKSAFVHNLPAPRPDFANLRRVLLRQGEPARLPLVELLADDEAKAAFLGEHVPHPKTDDPDYTRDQHVRYLDFDIRFWYEAGYDYIGLIQQVPLPHRQLQAGDTAGTERSKRTWTDENTGPIMSWQYFEAYPWPKPADIDYVAVEWTCTHLPDGMQVIFCGPMGQFEVMSMLMGFTCLAMALVDSPDLVAAVAEKVGELQETIYRTVADMPNIGAFWMSDDLGFKTSTLLSPRHLSQYVSGRLSMPMTNPTCCIPAANWPA